MAVTANQKKILLEKEKEWDKKKKEAVQRQIKHQSRISKEIKRKIENIDEE